MPRQKIDEFIQALFADEIDHRNRARNDPPVAVLHELDVEENFVAETFFELAQLVAHCGRIESALEVSVGFVGLHGPERGVVPGVVGEQRPGAQAEIGAGVGDFAASCRGRPLRARAVDPTRS